MKHRTINEVGTIFQVSHCGIKGVCAALSLILLPLLQPSAALFAQTVSIQNISHPGTALEPGETVGITINGAAAFGAVTVVANGGSPYAYGNTDGTGFWSTTSSIISAHIGSWTEFWYVNGSPLTIVNPDATYVPYAPNLPGFQVTPIIPVPIAQLNPTRLRRVGPGHQYGTSHP